MFAAFRKFLAVAIAGLLLCAPAGARMRGGAAVPGNLFAQRLIGGHGYMPVSTTTANTSTRVRHQFRILVHTGPNPATELELPFANYFVNVDAASNPGNTATIGADVELTSPVKTVAATWGGNPTVTMTDGQAIAVSDPVLPASFGMSTFPANTNIWIRIKIDVVLNGVYCVGNQPGASDQFAASDATNDQTANTGVLTSAGGGGIVLSATGSGQVPPFLGLIGKTTIPTEGVGSFGDSIAQYFHDVDDSSGAAGGGYLARGSYNAAIGWTKMARSSATAIGTLAGSWSKSQAILPYLSTAIFEWSVNDVTAGTSAATIFAALKSYTATARTAGVQRIVWTLTSTNTTSTNSWTAPDGSDQTPKTNFVTSGIADQLRAMAIGAVGTATGPDQVFDPRTYWDYQGGNLWAGTGVANATTDDGLHPVTAPHITAAAAVTTMIQAWGNPPR